MPWWMILGALVWAGTLFALCLCIAVAGADEAREILIGRERARGER